MANPELMDLVRNLAIGGGIVVGVPSLFGYIFYRIAKSDYDKMEPSRQSRVGKPKLGEFIVHAYARIPKWFNRSAWDEYGKKNPLNRYSNP